jgi:hypothetical protein
MGFCILRGTRDENLNGLRQTKGDTQNLGTWLDLGGNSNDDQTTWQGCHFTVMFSIECVYLPRGNDTKNRWEQSGGGRTCPWSYRLYSGSIGIGLDHHNLRPWPSGDTTGHRWHLDLSISEICLKFRPDSSVAHWPPGSVVYFSVVVSLSLVVCPVWFKSCPKPT